MAGLVDPGARFDTPGADPYRVYQGFSIYFLIFLSGGALYNFFQLIQNKVLSQLC